jgi:hypothetical protein
MDLDLKSSKVSEQEMAKQAKKEWNERGLSIFLLTRWGVLWFLSF